MISLNLSAVKENEETSARIAAAIAAFEARGGQFHFAPGFYGKPKPPARSQTVDPSTVLKRRRKKPTATECITFRELAEAL
ncbi:hypothetical protein [Pseudomonas graminis]|uniref:Uncharacterized protein n=1 Tax=Pseudomonas graminis TaxID=158627 RepID=A0A1I0JJB7_9PSED|nr:hypothetical protein [Pseudomonas graminis]SEU10177.1 hypothetical protein SAMN05216197_1609 [Pseudomonas graminis]